MQNYSFQQQIFNDIKIQLARKIRTAILSLYRKNELVGCP